MMAGVIGIASMTSSAAMFLQDTSSKVAYVARPGGPVDTSAYMWAGYAIVIVVYGSYIALLLRRNAKLRSQPRISP